VTSLTVAPVSKSCDEARQLGTRAGCSTLAAVATGSGGVDDWEPAGTESMKPPCGTSEDMRHTRLGTAGFLGSFTAISLSTQATDV